MDLEYMLNKALETIDSMNESELEQALIEAGYTPESKNADKDGEVMKLKPCPCGCADVDFRFDSGDCGHSQEPWSVMCNDLFGCAWDFGWFSTKEDAAIAWNTRAESHLEAENRELREALEELIERVNRARNILQHTTNGNWGMLDTKEVKNILSKYKEN